MSKSSTEYPTSLRLPGEFRRRIARVKQARPHLRTWTAAILFLIEAGLRQEESAR